MLTIRHVHDGRVSLIAPEALHEAAGNGELDHGFVWVDLEAPTDEEERILEHPALGLDPLVIEDMRDDVHLPKLEVLADQLSLTVHGIRLDTAEVELDTVELDLALKRRLLVTFREEPLASVDRVAQRLDRTGGLRVERPTQLLHLILDVLTDVLVPFLDLIEQRLDWIEEDILTAPSDATRREIYELQRDLIQLRRAVLPQAEVIRRMSREPLPFLVEGDLPLFRDVYDHLYRMAELSGSYRELLESALQSYRSALDDDLNRTVGLLTVVSALLLPISVVAGIYGMNFEVMPELGWNWAYFALLGVFATYVVAATLWLRRRRLLGRHREARARHRHRTAQVLEIPVLGEVLRLPGFGARALVTTSRGLVRLPVRLGRILTGRARPGDRGAPRG